MKSRSSRCWRRGLPWVLNGVGLALLIAWVGYYLKLREDQFVIGSLGSGNLRYTVAPNEVPDWMVAALRPLAWVEGKLTGDQVEIGKIVVNPQPIMTPATTEMDIEWFQFGDPPAP